MEILTFILVVIIFINSLNIKKRLSELEGGNYKHTQQDASQKEVTPTAALSFTESANKEKETAELDYMPQVVTVPEEVPKQKTYSDPYVPREPSELDKRFGEFIDWIKKDWLAKAGALILLIGIGWFVSYAFAEGWVGVNGRIAIGLIVGTAILVFGYVRIQNYEHQGSLFLILGSTTVLTTVWSARSLYDLFSPVVALTIMFLSVAFVSLVAVLKNKSSLATVSLILALGAPQLINNPNASFTMLPLYLLVVVVGTVWIVVKTGWRHLLLISLIGVFLYTLPYSFNVSPDIAGIALLFSFIFSGIFAIVSNRTLMRSGTEPNGYDLATVIGIGLYLFTWINAAAPAHWESLLYTAWAVAFAGIGFVVFKITKNVKTFLIYIAIGLTYLVLATIATFDGPLLTIALTLEAGMVPALAYILTKRKELLSYLSLLMLGPVFLSLESIVSSEWNRGVSFDHLSVLLILGLVLMVLGVFTYEKGKELADSEISNWGAGMALFGSLYFLILIWLVPRGASSPNFDVGKLVSLVIYTIIGVATYVIGHVKESAKIRFIGGALAGLVILRLLFVEVWDMQVSTRIITFLLVGVLLIATAFIEKKKKD